MTAYHMVKHPSFAILFIGAGVPTLSIVFSGELNSDEPPVGTSAFLPLKEESFTFEEKYGYYSISRIVDRFRSSGKVKEAV
jgi:hypothetical protein